MSDCNANQCNDCAGCTCGVEAKLSAIIELLEKMQTPSKPENYEGFLERAEQMIAKLKEI